MPVLPTIPETITVHLGPPNSDAENVTVNFVDYIKNVASSEIYPTWPESALRANIYAQISFALNRIYTEYYRSRGYPFDITNSTAYDQYFVPGRDIFENINEIVNDIFNNYISREGSVEPLFAQYCNGTTVTCEGLSQWGTVELARQGLTPYEILQYYYGDDINIETAPIQTVGASYPGRPLRVGDRGDAVRFIQVRLNRISTNYPSIPKIDPVDGIFDADTREAVLAFQRAFNMTQDGVVGSGTWYQIVRIYNAVKRLNELNSEGLQLSEVELQYPEYIRPGDENFFVRVIQYYLNYISQYESTIAPVPQTGYFGSQTEEAVRAFQRAYGLTEDGIVGRETYNKMIDVYLGMISSQPPDLFTDTTPPFPGQQLVLGSEGEYVRLLQEYLNAMASVYPSIPTVTVDGDFGAATERAVRAAQEVLGIPVSGVVGAVAWQLITDAYNDIRAGRYTLPNQYSSVPD